METRWTRKLLKTKCEDEFYDRKSTHIKPIDLARHIIAFFNSEGGTLAIGIEDDFTITGIDNYKAQINELKAAPINLCSPSLRCVYKELPVIDDKDKENHILLIHVPKGHHVHSSVSKDA